MAEGLSQLEQDLVSHIETYGMTATRAGSILGIDNPQHVLAKPHVKAAREQMRRAVQQRSRITKEDVVNGIKEAIDQAKLLGDPTAQIRGWSEIGKLYDFYSPKRVSVQLTGAITEVRRELAALPDDQLMALFDDEDVIDADFYRVSDGDDPVL